MEQNWANRKEVLMRQRCGIEASATTTAAPKATATASGAKLHEGEEVQLMLDGKSHEVGLPPKASATATAAGTNVHEDKQTQPMLSGKSDSVDPKKA